MTRAKVIEPPPPLANGRKHRPPTRPILSDNERALIAVIMAQGGWIVVKQGDWQRDLTALRNHLDRRGVEVVERGHALWARWPWGPVEP